MRGVADTNVIVSGILWIGAPHTILIAAEDVRVTLYSSPALLQEIEGVLKRPKFAPRLRDLQVTAEEVTAAFVRQTFPKS
jgi:putative PIN family toxin of toxin-antitoxin system